MVNKENISDNIFETVLYVLEMRGINVNLDESARNLLEEIKRYVRLCVKSTVGAKKCLPVSKTNKDARLFIEKNKTIS